MKELADYKKGDLLGGDPINAIVGRNADLMVCTVDLEGGGLGIHWITADAHAFSDEQRKLLAEFNRRYDDIHRYTSSDNKNRRVESLAQDLYTGLVAGGDPATVFGEVDRYVARIATSEVRLFYVSGAIAVWFVVVVMLSLLLLIPREGLRPYLIAGLLGSLGALISVLTKYSAMGVDHFPGRAMSCLGGAARIALGVLFGAVAVLAAKVGLLLTILLEKDGGQYLIAIVAGFSERLVPDLLRQQSEPDEE